VHYCLWNVYLPSVVRCIPYTVIEIFDCNCNDLELGRFKVDPRSKVMVPIESPLVVSYLTSFESNIVSLTVFEIFDIKYAFHRSNGED